MVTSPAYHIIYDGNCNLCVTFVQLLEEFDRVGQFSYTPMQEQAVLSHWGITPQDCELGMILIKNNDPRQRWQGSDAAEEVARLLPLGSAFVEMYRAIPGMKTLGDRLYSKVRDNRYVWFGGRTQTYRASDCDCGTGFTSDNSSANASKV